MAAPATAIFDRNRARKRVTWVSPAWCDPARERRSTRQAKNHITVGLTAPWPRPIAGARFRWRRFRLRGRSAPTALHFHAPCSPRDGGAVDHHPVHEESCGQDNWGQGRGDNSRHPRRSEPRRASRGPSTRSRRRRHFRVLRTLLLLGSRRSLAKAREVENDGRKIGACTACMFRIPPRMAARWRYGGIVSYSAAARSGGVGTHFSMRGGAPVFFIWASQMRWMRGSCS
jgi:hypothetical protein